MFRIPRSPVVRHISDDELLEINQPKLANLTSCSKQKPQRPKIQIAEIKEQINKKQTLYSYLEELKNFLLQIKNFPKLNVSQLYSSLNLSGRKGNKLKAQLLANKLIQEEIIQDLKI